MNNLKVKLTEEGLKLLNEKIAIMEKKVKDIQSEKSIAYTASGDGWHDNPGFNQLEQKEFQAVNELQNFKNMRDEAKVIVIDKRNIETVQIGSIVKIEHFYFSKNSSQIFTWEIVGHQESDLKKGRIAYDTPVGSVLLGKKVEESFELELPVGRTKLKIIRLFEDWNSVKE